jgi:hypothetical protein
MILKQVAKSLLPNLAIDLYRERKQYQREKRDIDRYLLNPLPPPPACLKRRTVREYGKRHNLRVLIETGTWCGDMVAYCRSSFSAIYSIEIDPELAANAQQRFRNDRHIRVLHGDSGKLLPGILSEINEPAVFWLDGHFSGPGTGRGEKDTPLEEELDAIIFHPIKDHVILVDDVRMFGTTDYPPLETLERKLIALNPRGTFEVSDDILRFAPPCKR